VNKPIREGFVEDEPVSVAVDPKNMGASAVDDEPLEPSAEPEWPVKVKLLNKPIKGNRNEELTELVFREPTAGDINRYGNPVRVDLAGDVHVDDRRMLFMMTALCGVLTPLLEKMDPRDYASACYRLRVFFIPNPAAW
jgi:Phage tail assembly chaperone proteins, E, or 41 or 14